MPVLVSETGGQKKGAVVKFNLRNATALTVAFMMTGMTVAYCYLAVTGETAPVLTSWVLFAVATSLGLATYLKVDKSERGDVVTNIANTIDPVICWVGVLVLAFFGKRVRITPTVFEITCLVGAVAIFWYWKKSDNSRNANLAVNLLLSVAYVPTFINLWYAKENTESFLTWGVALVACSISLINPIRERDFLAKVYAARAITLVVILMSLMLRLELAT